MHSDATIAEVLRLLVPLLSPFAAAAAAELVRRLRGSDARDEARELAALREDVESLRATLRETSTTPRVHVAGAGACRSSTSCDRTRPSPGNTARTR